MCDSDCGVRVEEIADVEEMKCERMRRWRKADMNTTG